MNTLRSLSAFGLMVFTIWAFPTTQTLGAELTCPCASERETLLTAMIRGFPAAGSEDRTVDTICDTHPVRLVSGVGPSPFLGGEAVSGVEPTPFKEIFAEFDVAEGVGSCDWEAFGGVQPQPFLPARTAWRCINELAAACRALGYKSLPPSPVLE